MNGIIEKIFDYVCDALAQDHNSCSKKVTRAPSCYLFFDTETSGLPRDYNLPASCVNNWPRLVQLSWILTDANRNVIHTHDYVIKPEGFIIPYSASNVHGITTKYAEQHGASLREVLELFLADLKEGVLVVGHNVSFDKNVVGAELIRCGFRNKIAHYPSVCTMKSTTNYCQIPGYYYGYKYPKLQELHEILFGYEFDDAHDSMSDVSATMRCY